VTNYSVAEVRIWNRRVGAVAEATDGTVVFEYDDEFRATKLEISPIHLPLSVAGPQEFPELRSQEAFRGLPGVLADALPDRFGTAVIQRYFQDLGDPRRALSPVQKLLYVGDRAMGALEFRPAQKLGHLGDTQPLQISQLAAEARSIVEGNVEVAVPRIIRVGSSAGGVRPKALVLWNPAERTIKSGFAEPSLGDEPYLLKFDGVGESQGGSADPTPQPYMRIEHAYSCLAKEAGLDVVETQLLEERGLAHLLIRRFDRSAGRRIHQHTLGGLQHVDYNLPGAFSYDRYLRTVQQLGIGFDGLVEAFRRTVFNVVSVNQDDHVKNFSFLMDPSGSWDLSPAYDLTFARGSHWTSQHQMTVNGKGDGITRADLESLAAKHGLSRKGGAVIDRVCATFKGWELAADAAGVPDESIAAVRRELRRRGLAEEP